MAINASQGVFALGLLTLLFGGDVVKLFSGSGVSPAAANTGVTEDAARQVLTQHFPGTEVLGSSYPIPAHKAVIAKMLTTAQFGAIGFMLAGEQLCGVLGVPVPQIYQQYREKKSGIILAIWFLGNALHNQLTATGAFEVFYDGHLVFSKLQTGRLPAVDELVDILETAMGLPPSFEHRNSM